MPARQTRSAAGAVLAHEVAPFQELSLRLVRRLRKQSASGLTLSQTSALSTLERNGPMRIGELARREQIGKSSVTRLVAKLEAMDYLTREVDPDDGRSALVRISAPGYELLRQARERGNEYLAAELGRLDAADRAALLDALPALERLVTLRQQPPGG